MLNNLSENNCIEPRFKRNLEGIAADPMHGPAFIFLTRVAEKAFSHIYSSRITVSFGQQ